MPILDRRQWLAALGLSLAAQAGQAQEPGHQRYMRRAIELAGHAPRFPFGALLVDSERGVIVAEGWNKSPQNPIWHGEIDAMNRCAAQNPGIDWSRLILYTTAEPCPMCQSAVAWAGVGMVVYGSSIPFLKSLNWPQIDIRAEEIAQRTPFRKCAIIGGILERDCDALFRAAAAHR